MMTVRRGADRGHANHGWLDTHHTFSFADYHDPRYMGWGAMRVLNDDTVAPGAGFPPHSHRDMEIISYVLDGALEHRDSMGTGSTIRPGDIQRMSAGRGVTHSENNASQEEPVHFLQIWIVPKTRGAAPGYEQKHFPDAQKQDRLCLVASPDGQEGSVRIQADAWVFAAKLTSNRGPQAGLPAWGGKAEVAHRFGPDRKAWLQVARGAVTASGLHLGAGDGVAIEGESEIVLGSTTGGEVLLFDLGG